MCVLGLEVLAIQSRYRTDLAVLARPRFRRYGIEGVLSARRPFGCVE